jgi:hypothetical protein
MYRFEFRIFGFNTILNRYLFQKLKLIRNGKFNYLINIIILPHHMWVQNHPY